MGNGDLVTDLSGALSSTASVHSGDGQSSHRDDNANVRRRSRLRRYEKDGHEDKAHDAVEENDLEKDEDDLILSLAEIDVAFEPHNLDSLA
jgi:hypothetical protein